MGLILIVLLGLTGCGTIPTTSGSTNCYARKVCKNDVCVITYEGPCEFSDEFIERRLKYGTEY